MDLHIRQPFQDTFAISIAFIVGAPLLTFLLILASSLTGDGFAASQRPSDWLATCLSVAAYAGFAGILVDSMRLVTKLVWRKKIPFRLKLKKILKDNLASREHRVGKLKRS